MNPSKRILHFLFLLSTCCNYLQSTLAFTQPTSSFKIIHHNNGYPTSNLDQKFKQITKKNVKRTKLNMVAPSPAGAAALVGAISGGLLGGALHAIAGKMIEDWLHSFLKETTYFHFSSDDKVYVLVYLRASVLNPAVDGWRQKIF